MTNPIKNDALSRRKNKQRIVEEHTEKEYYVCGKKTNKNVYELQQIYESTQAKTTKILPEFIERIRFMIVKGILKATYKKRVDQTGELFHYVLDDIISKIVPTVDPSTKQLVTKYKKEKANLGAYILNQCYWAVVSYNDTKQWFDNQLSCSDFLEDYSKVSDKPINHEIGGFKFISKYEEGNTYVPLIQAILQGEQ